MKPFKCGPRRHRSKRPIYLRSFDARSASFPGTALAVLGLRGWTFLQGFGASWT
ncbi:MAG: hypothetical protein ACJA1F_000503 [Paracoccaceae bacterium]|jgi:hypothetical protein